jgi:hypothetical protein
LGGPVGILISIDHQRREQGADAGAPGAITRFIAILA